MAIVRGKDVVLLGWDSDEASWVPYACARSVTFTVNTSFIEVSITGSGKYRNFRPEANTHQGSLEGIMDLGKPNYYLLPDVRYKQINHERQLMRFEREDEDGNTYTDEANFYFASTTDTSSFDNVTTFNFDIQGDGPITQVFTPSPIIGLPVTSYYYPSNGSGETGFTNAALIGKNVLGAWRQTDHRVITTGTVVFNEIKYNSATGGFTWVIPMEAEEFWHIQYQ